MSAPARTRDVGDAVDAALPALHARLKTFSEPFTITAWRDAQCAAATACATRNNLRELYALDVASVDEMATASIESMFACAVRKMFDRAAQRVRAMRVKRERHTKQKAERRKRERDLGVVRHFPRRKQHVRVS